MIAQAADFVQIEIAWSISVKLFAATQIPTGGNGEI